MSPITVAESENRVCPIRQCHAKDLRCIGPACMAWVAVEQSPQRFHVCADPQAEIEPDRPGSIPRDWEWSQSEPSEGEPAGWIEPHKQASARNTGFCLLMRGPA